MNVTIKDDHRVQDVRNAIIAAFTNSRFSLEVEIVSAKRLKINKVRLWQKKDYCGSHPGACNIVKKHVRYNYLEGADWVEFNDTLNNTLDKIHANCRVASTVVLVRDGKKRCIKYRQQQGHGPNAEWARIGIYQDYCGKIAEPSTFPDGTPGIYDAIGYNIEG